MRYRERIEGDPSKSRIYKDVSQGPGLAGIEYFLPLFFDDTATLFDYLGDDALIVQHHDVQQAATVFWQDVKAATTWRAATPSAPRRRRPTSSCARTN